MMGIEIEHEATCWRMSGSGLVVEIPRCHLQDAADQWAIYRPKESVRLALAIVDTTLARQPGRFSISELRELHEVRRVWHESLGSRCAA